MSHHVDVIKLLICAICGTWLLCDALYALGNADANDCRRSEVNVKDFSSLVQNDEWSGAIQAAIDYVKPENGYEMGATIYFPPGIYRIDKTIVLGNNLSQYGVRLSGYGAALVGTETLDKQPSNYEEREKAFKDAGQDFDLLALPGELDNDGKNVGPAILELWLPPHAKETPYTLYEGASYVLEGLTFNREKSGMGVGIKIPAETIPKNITFRDLKIHNQNVGIHINHCYQIRMDSCIIRGNKIGVWGRNHFNAISIINSSFRRNLIHGLVLGPNASEWGSSAIYIAGNIFESNTGYGILNAGGCQVTIIGNYFEANGNDVGVLTRFSNTTIDTNHFWGFYGNGWNTNSIHDTIVSDKAHIIIDSQDVRIRGNKYFGGDAILVFGLSGANSFDALPVVAEGVQLQDGLKAGDSNGTGLYLYEAGTGKFKFCNLLIAEALPASKAATPENQTMNRQMQKRTCNVCGHVYNPAVGDAAGKIAAGTPFESLPDTWHCPACKATKEKFTPSEP